MRNLKTRSSQEFMEWVKENNWIILRNQDDIHLVLMSPAGRLWEVDFEEDCVYRLVAADDFEE